MKKTALALTIILVLLTSTVGGFLFVNLASANPMIPPGYGPIAYIYIKSDGTIEPANASIQKVGNVYLFLSDLPLCSVVVQCDNVVVNGNGFAISGYGGDWYEGITLSANDVTIKNVTFRAFSSGIDIAYGSNNTIIGNSFAASRGVGITFTNSNIIIGNNFWGSGYGVSGAGSFNSIISNNFESDSDDFASGIMIQGNNNTISGNYLFKKCISLMTVSQYNEISNNTVEYAQSGIRIIRSNSNLIQRNVIRGATYPMEGGIYLSSGSYNNVVIENRFENNVVAITLGVQILDRAWNSVYNNSFYRNNFLNNEKYVFVANGVPANYWDNGKEGNYWHNYNGRDEDKDGIGDTAYVIDANNQDRYPLMEQFVASELPSPSPSQSPSASPEPQQSEVFPTAYSMGFVAVIVLVLLGAIVYVLKRKR